LSSIQHDSLSTVRDQTSNGVFGGALMIAQDRFRTRFIDAQSNDESLLAELDAIDHESAQAQRGQIPFAQILHSLTAGDDESVTFG
jgi:hypothetical protein